MTLVMFEIHFRSRQIHLHKSQTPKGISSEQPADTKLLFKVMRAIKALPEVIYHLHCFKCPKLWVVPGRVEQRFVCRLLTFSDEANEGSANFKSFTNGSLEV